MIKTEQIKGSDVVLLANDTMHGLADRYKEYGIRGVFAANKPIKLGLVCEYNGAKVIVSFGDKATVEPFIDCEKNIKEVYRNNNYINEFASLDLQDSAMAMFANSESYKAIKKNTKSNIGGVILYILSSSRVRYQLNFAEFKFKLYEILNENNGFYRII
jgi:hypothetical protein